MATSRAAYSYLQPRARGFWWVFIGSAVLHIGVLAAYALASEQRRPTIDLSERAIMTKLVKLGKKREPKLLPRKSAAPAVKPAEKLLATEEAKEPDVKPREDDKKRALDRIREEAERRKAREQALQRVADRLGEDEDEGDPEGSRHGTETQAAQLSLTQAYFGKVHDRIKDYYNVPSIISEAERRTLSAVVVIFLAPDGTLLKHELERSSGSDAFDRALEAAVVRASPLPAPPAFLRDTVRDGVAVRFRP